MAPGAAPQRSAPAAGRGVRLGVSIAGLARGGVSEALTTEQIDALRDEDPEWLRRERATQAEVRKEAARIKEKHAEQAAKRS